MSCLHNRERKKGKQGNFSLLHKLPLLHILPYNASSRSDYHLSQIRFSTEFKMRGYDGMYTINYCLAKTWCLDDVKLDWYGNNWMVFYSVNIAYTQVS